MNWEILSLIGILLGMGVFIYLQTKSTFLIISTFLGAIVIALSSGMGIQETIFNHWATGFAGFMKNNFLIFTLSALFGKVFYMGGAARRIALSVGGLCARSKKNVKFFSIMFVVFIYTLLNYVGINGFVVIFCVYGIAKELFIKNDVPWRLFAFGGASMNIGLVLGGNLVVANVVLSKTCGTGLAGNMGMSVVLAVFYLLLIVLSIQFVLHRAKKKGEGFMETGEEIAKMEVLEMENLPSLGLSAIPLVLVISLASIFKLNAALAVFISILACLILYRKNYTNISTTLQQGLTTGMITACGLAAITAMIALLKATPGYGVILSSMNGLPPLIQGVALTSVMCFISAAPVAAATAVGPDAFALFTSIGMSPGTAHTLMNTTWWGSILPWSAGPANCVATAKIKFNKCMPIYFIGVCCYFLTMILAVVLVQLGVFV